MIGKQKRKGITKWLAISILLALVSVTTILQAYSFLGVSTRIASTHKYIKSHITNRKQNTSMVTENASIQNDNIFKYLEVKPVKSTSTRNIFTYNIPEYNTKSVNITPKALSNTSQKKITHIGFLKVHKAGSTTMQNIFFRFGLKYNLTFVLPEKGHYFLSTKSAMPVAPGNHRDILACHSVYSRNLFGSVLPEDTVNIGIIREPLERMISAAYYYRDVWKSPLLVKVPRLNFIHNLVNRPHLYELKPFTKTKNAMGQDFGFSPTTSINDTDYIKKHLDLLKKDFKQVLVMERFEESLILMKRTLNWDLADVIYLKTNSHAHQPVILTPYELDKFKSTCFLDYAVYETFYEIFDKKIAAEGPDFINEVEHFKSVLQLVKDFCELGTRKLLKIAQSAWNEPFEVTKQDCLYMQMKELKFVEFLKRRHRELNIMYDLMKNYDRNDVLRAQRFMSKRTRPVHHMWKTI
ncbi:galactose-3-O-sulfotransferase 2-like [Mercenaria mercenaria]|uniref:galactose-3-O-sulfotransferase 2-like n=1 Tax=Mercenaria mercenaria TaxID=6596 RepID=UPI001E1D6FE8|nr:galactose-3-O-sulfotransferase 2-like [Mercenaria mercenaria]